MKKKTKSGALSKSMGHPGRMNVNPDFISEFLEGFRLAGVRRSPELLVFKRKYKRKFGK